VRANIYIFRRRVIGGDISSIKLDGFMIPLEKRENVINAE
jgi:hypothetical protein